MEKSSPIIPDVVIEDLDIPKPEFVIEDLEIPKPQVIIEEIDLPKPELTSKKPTNPSKA